MTAPTPSPGPARRWRLAPPPPPELTASSPDLHPVLLAALHRRGLADPGAIRAFLAHAPGPDDPFRMAGMAAAVTRLRSAIRAREPVVVYGDYDADGVTATALLIQTLRALGAEVRAYIPHRARDGYGVHGAALAALAAAGARVVVTVDCGIRSAAEVDAAAAQGLDVIVTDHHVLPDELPRAVAVLNPRRPDCGYGFTELAGVGLAFKLAQALLRVDGQVRGGRPAVAEDDLVDLAALGTVADVVPLVAENRALVARGLAALRAARRPGLAALMASAGVAPETITARGLAFALGPRLNAASRMDDADVALALLLTDDAATAARHAETLEARNTARRQATEDALATAEARLADRIDGPLLCYASPTMPLGVLGLVASRLAERHDRPALVARLEGELARGSARSVPEFHITEALAESADLLVRFGGHARAAGFTMRAADLPELERRLSARAAAALDGLDLRPVLDIDAEVAPRAVDWDLYHALGALEPTGEGNPPGVLLLRTVAVTAARVVGQGHLKLVVAAGPDFQGLEAMAFGQAARLSEVGRAVDLACGLHANTWNGATRLELRVHDLAPPSLRPR